MGINVLNDLPEEELDRPGTCLDVPEVGETCGLADVPVYQVGTQVSGDPVKYRIGQLLRYLGCADDCSPLFKKGDLIRVCDRNNPDGQGIRATRESDGVTDSVWPEEVEPVAELGEGMARAPDGMTSREAAEELSRTLGVTEAEVAALLTSYPLGWRPATRLERLAVLEVLRHGKWPSKSAARWIEDGLVSIRVKEDAGEMELVLNDEAGRTAELARRAAENVIKEAP